MKHRKKKTPATKHSRRKQDRHPGAVSLVEFAPRVLAIEYQRNGTAYRHHFTKPPKLYKSKNGALLILGPVRVGKWIED